MRNRVLIVLAVFLLRAASLVSAQPPTDELSQLRERVARLEKQVQEMSKLLEPLKAQRATETRQRALRENFERKMAEDRNKHSAEQLNEAEGLYQVANQKWGSAEAAESLQKMIEKYPDINRTGCATLYVAQRSQGETREKYLRQCVEKFNDCFYGDGVQVGAYARFLLAQYYRSNEEPNKAAALFEEIRTKYPNAIDHGGNLLVDSLGKEQQ